MKSIGKNTTLKSLSINFNEISDKGIEYIASNIHLKSLHLGSSLITDNGAVLLSKHKSLNKITLFDSKIKRKGAEAFYGRRIEDVKLSTSGKQYLYIAAKELEEFNHNFRLKNK